MASSATNRNDSLGHGLTLGLGAVTKRERSPSPSDCMSPDTINNPPSPADSSTYLIFKTHRNTHIFHRIMISTFYYLRTCLSK